MCSGRRQLNTSDRGSTDDGKRWSRWTLHRGPLGIYKRGGAGGEGTQIGRDRVLGGARGGTLADSGGIIVFRAGLFFCTFLGVVFLLIF